MYAVLLIVLTIIFGYIFKYFRYLRNFDKLLDHVPRTKTWPILGNIADLSSTKHIIPTLMRYTKEYGGLFRLYLGPQPTIVVVAEINFMEFLLSSTKIIKKAPQYNALHVWLGEGILTSTGEKWQKRRKAITPTFHFKILEQFVEVFNSTSNILIKKLSKGLNEDKTDVYPYVSLYTLDVVCETAMGISINSQLNEHSEYVQSVKEMGRIFIDKEISVLKHFGGMFRISRDYYKQKAALKVLHGTTLSVIRQRREILKKTKKDETEQENDVGVKKRVAFLDMLLQTEIDGRLLTESEIQEEVDTIMFEGHDTTASGISFTLLCLAQNPIAQQAAYEEIKAIFGQDKNRPCTYRDLQEMKYLELVIKESLRLYPSVPAYGRQLTTDIEYDGNVWPKDLVLIIFAYGLHRCPELYEDPDAFKPERFLKNRSGENAYSYIPFSAGPRNCVGQKFAMLEMKAALSKILRNFELFPVEGFSPILKFETILKSHNGINVTIRKRAQK